MRKFTVILVLLGCLPLITFSQSNNGGGYKSRLWKTMRYELIAGVGTNTFMGELGGGKKQAAHFFGVRDFDIQSTRPTFHLGGRYKIFERVALHGGVSYARLYGDDAFSGEPGRLTRNLSFKTNLWEFAGQLEFSILKENRGRRYLFQRNSFINNINLYVFGGVGYFHYNPKAELDGQTYELQPLGTSGQGIVNPATGETLDPYKLWAVSFPAGLGLKYYLTKHWSVGTEIGYRFTNTDWIDDVGGTKYFDNDLIRATYGDVAATLSDRHVLSDIPVYQRFGGVDDPNGLFVPYDHGFNTRGNQDQRMDGYVFLLFNLTYTFENRARSGPKFTFAQKFN